MGLSRKEGQNDSRRPFDAPPRPHLKISLELRRNRQESSHWQVSRVYAALRQPDLSLHFAKASLEIGEKNSLLEVVLSANEAMARAYATGKKYQLAKEFLDKAKSQLHSASLDDDDRKVYSDQIRETELMIKS